MEELMKFFGPWLPWLFGVGTVLLVGGLLTTKFATDSSIRGVGRGVASAGLRLMLFAAAIYLLIKGLGAVFEGASSNLPGM